MNNTASLQMVLAPDAVIAALGGKFVSCATMADVAPRHRVGVNGPSELDFWNVRTHVVLPVGGSARDAVQTTLLSCARLARVHCGNSCDGGKDRGRIPIAVWTDVLERVQRRELGGYSPRGTRGNGAHACPKRQTLLATDAAAPALSARLYEVRGIGAAAVAVVAVLLAAAWMRRA
jgi:hypothetical protein